jgi:[CysO sulfur-carrier protein]-S-L-cysteine hydrolase
MTLELPRRFVDEIIARARADAPDECWGLLAGPPGEVEAVFHLKNGAPPDERPFRYTVEPRSFMEASDAIYERDWQVLGIYHSHTHTQPYPSPTDIEHANPDFGDIVYLIVSLREAGQPFVYRGMDDLARAEARAYAQTHPAEPELRGWHIRDGRAVAADVRVTP